MEPEYAEAGFINLFVSRCDNSAEALDPLLRLVADYRALDVILTASRLDWLYHPYDGGGDVIAHDKVVRDALAHRFEDWLPSNSAGL